MSLTNTLACILNHPLNRQHRLSAMGKFLRWQIGSRLVPGPVVFPWVGGTRFLVYRGETSLTANIYTGLFEFRDMAFLLHFLRPDDVFYDVGANVGAFTLLASGAASARSYAFEPIPATYARLVENVQINRLNGKVHCLNNGLGAERSSLLFTTDREGSMNRVATPTDNATKAIHVDVLPLDDVATECPIAIKVDVEGYESAVLSGAQRTLANPMLRAVTLELCGSNEHYGASQQDIIDTMSGFGFERYSYDPFTRTLSRGHDEREMNSLFVRDVTFVTDRLRSAPSYKAHGHVL